MHPSVVLYKMYLRSIFTRIYYDLIQELVVGTCSCVMVSLFLYMFQDFINVKLAVIPSQTQEMVARIFAFLIYLLSLSYSLKTIKSWKSELNSFESFGLLVGTKPTHIRLFLIVRALIFVVCIFTFTGLVIFKLIYQPSAKEFTATSMLGFIVIASSFFKSRSRETLSGKSVKAMKFKQGQATLINMLRWRIIQLLQRNKATRVCILSALTFVILTALVSWLSLSFSLAVLSALASGFLATGAMIFQLKDDIQNSWLEKNCGVTHASIIRVYRVLAITIGTLLGAANVIAYMICNSFSTQKVGLLLTMSLVAPLLFPPLMFQVDARRPTIQFLMVFLATLFIGTGIYAYPILVLAIPIFDYYGHSYQNNRYYTA